MDLESYLLNLKERKSKTKANNLIQETVEPFEKYIVWKDYLKERWMLYAGAEICNKVRGFGVLKERMEWVKKKNSVLAIGVYNFLKR